MTVLIESADPLGAAALSLLREAALEARALYPQPGSADAPMPGNAPLPPRGVYLLAWQAGVAVGMAAHRPIDDQCTELRRVFVQRQHRRQGVAWALLQAVQQHAAAQGFVWMRLETGFRQRAALRLYEAAGFKPIAAFGPYGGDDTSRCFEKRLTP